MRAGVSEGGGGWGGGGWGGGVRGAFLVVVSVCSC